jgi:hypothetical protein
VFLNGDRFADDDRNSGADDRASGGFH